MVKHVRFEGAYKCVEERGKVVRYHPAIGSIRRMSPTRREFLLALKKRLLAGQSIQEIVKETGWDKRKLYHEMYYLKKLGWIPSDFKNPFSIWYKDPKELLVSSEKEFNTGGT